MQCMTLCICQEVTHLLAACPGVTLMPVIEYMLDEHDVSREAPAQMQCYTLTQAELAHSRPTRGTDSHMEQSGELPQMQTVSISSRLSQTHNSLH